MTQERLTRLLSYVMKVNAMYKGEIQASIMVDYIEESLKIWFDDKQYGAKVNRYYCYHTNGLSADRTRGGIRSIYDPNLVKAEKHILRVLCEADVRGDSSERQAISG